MFWAPTGKPDRQAENLLLPFGFVQAEPMTGNAVDGCIVLHCRLPYLRRGRFMMCACNQKRTETGGTNMAPRFRTDFTVSAHDTDANGVCRASCILRYLQEAANQQLYHLGPTPKDLENPPRAFVISRLSMDILEPLTDYDKGYATSWPLPSRGVCFDRHYELFCNDKPVARAVSQWALLDVTDKMLLHVEDMPFHYARNEQMQVKLPIRMRIPKEISMEPVGKKEVRYEDIDKNQHMNNTNYPNLFCDFLPMQNQRVKHISINFSHEAPLGEVLTLYRGFDLEQNIWYLRSFKGDGSINAEAAVVLCEIR